MKYRLPSYKIGYGSKCLSLPGFSVKNLSYTEEIDLAAKYDGGHLLNRFFLTICAAASRQNGWFLWTIT